MPVESGFFMTKIQTIELPILPRNITGLKKDGTRDKRYKYTITAILIEIQTLEHTFNRRLRNFGMWFYEESLED